MDGLCCRDCQFGHQELRGTVFALNHEDGWGTCRRHAPTVLEMRPPDGPEHAETVFPRVQADDWCADFKAADRRSGGYAGLDCETGCGI